LIPKIATVKNQKSPLSKSKNNLRSPQNSSVHDSNLGTCTQAAIALKRGGRCTFKFIRLSFEFAESDGPAESGAAV